MKFLACREISGCGHGFPHVILDLPPDTSTFAWLIVFIECGQNVITKLPTVLKLTGQSIPSLLTSLHIMHMIAQKGVWHKCNVSILLCFGLYLQI